MDTKLITHRIENNVCVIKIIRKFISPEISELVKYITPILEEKTIRGLLINLGGDILIDSVMVGFLITTLKDCQARKTKYALCEINPDFSGIFQNFKNVKSDQFLGIFETEADALKSFEEHGLSSKSSSRKAPSSKTRVVTKETFYFVGPKTNWKFSRDQLVALAIFSVGIFLAIIGITTYQHFFYQSLFAKLQQQIKEQSIKNQELERNSKELEQQHIVFEQQIDQKKFLLSLAQKVSPSDKQKDATLQEKEETFLKEILAKKKILEDQTAQIENLKSQSRQSLRKVRFLKKKAQDLEKQLEAQKEQLPERPTTVPPTTIPSRLVQPVGLMIDQFIMTAKDNSISIQFNLRNISDEVHSGYIMILALREEELDQTILLDPDTTETFTIRRFRSFSKDFVQTPTTPYIAISLIVWDRNHKKLLEQHYPVE